MTKKYYVMLAAMYNRHYREAETVKERHRVYEMAEDTAIVLKRGDRSEFDYTEFLHVVTDLT